MNTSSPVKEFILCAAIHYKDGKVHTHQPVNIESGLVICGMRHCNCYSVLSGLLGDFDGKLLVGRDGQGFITSHDRYVDRQEAFLIAKANNQIHHKLFDNDDTGTLCSEDLY